MQNTKPAASAARRDDLPAAGGLAGGAAGPAHAPLPTAGSGGRTSGAEHGPLPRFCRGLRGRRGFMDAPAPSRAASTQRRARTDTTNRTCPGARGPKATLPARGRLPHGGAANSTSARATAARGRGDTHRGTRSPTAAGRRAPVPRWGGGKGWRPARRSPRAPLRSAQPWRAAAARGFQAARAQCSGPAPAENYTSQHAPRIWARAPPP